MSIVNLPMTGGFYQSQSRPLSSQECIGLYVSIPQTQTITKSNLFGTPGLDFLADAGGVNRGSHAFMGIPYFVNGTILQRLNLTFDGIGNEVWTLVTLGTIPGEKRVIMADNGRQLCIVIPELDETFNAFIVEDDVLTQISAENFAGPVSSVVFSSGFFVFTAKDGNSFFKSGLRDGNSYNALDFQNAESDPDPIKAPIVYRNQLIIFGSETMEGYQIVPTSSFPYLFTGAVERKGLISSSAIIEIEGLLFWLGGTTQERPQILRYDGDRPVPISTRAIETALRSYTREELENSFAWNYSEDGSDFVGFTFPDTCYVYDLSTGLWHERRSVDNTGSPTTYRISNVIEAYGFLIAADILNGNIGRLNKEVFTEYGTSIRRRVVFPPIDNDGDVTIVSGAELVCQTGVGLLPTQQGDTPEIRLSWSDDGGRTFEDPISESLGEIGDYNHRVFWNELGGFDRSRMFALDISDPVPIAFYKFEVDIDS
ncbi:MAG: packaged DNA stabilization protein [Dehalococcoidales bacterium]